LKGLQAVVGHLHEGHRCVFVQEYRHLPLGSAFINDSGLAPAVVDVSKDLGARDDPVEAVPSSNDGEETEGNLAVFQGELVPLFRFQELQAFIDDGHDLRLAELLLLHEVVNHLRVSFLQGLAMGALGMASDAALLRGGVLHFLLKHQLRVSNDGLSEELD